MTDIPFDKYQGAGNDFIIIDDRGGGFVAGDSDLIRRLCDRRFGVGADGLILVSRHDRADFEMRYFNADGRLGSMCGNGARCAAHFALKKGIAGPKPRFQAFDGIHEAEVSGDTVRLRMADVAGYRILEGNYFIDTGSPHYVVFTDALDAMDVDAEGRKLRWSPLFAPGGTNVNFVETDRGRPLRQDLRAGRRSGDLGLRHRGDGRRHRLVAAGPFRQGPCRRQDQGRPLESRIRDPGRPDHGYLAHGTGDLRLRGHDRGLTDRLNPSFRILREASLSGTSSGRAGACGAASPRAWPCCGRRRP